MKLKKGFITHETGDTQVMVAVGGAKFSGLIRSNRTAAFIVDQLKKETTRDAILEKMKERYDGVTDEVIGRDVDKVLNTLREVGALDE